MARLSPTEVCEKRVDMERRTCAAALASFSTLDCFAWNHPRSIDSPLYEHLFALGFLEHGQNVLLRGPSGVGKTTLALNLGLAALQHGGTVFAGAACIAALVDRFVQHCHVLDIEADSSRQKQSDTSKPQATSARKKTPKRTCAETHPSSTLAPAAQCGSGLRHFQDPVPCSA